MVKYNCRYCDWTYEGQVKTGVILEHDRTHPENKIEDCEYTKKTEVLSKPACNFCGCTEWHDND